MGETTAISWTDKTFNPWVGCLKVSPACDGCYAENLMANRYGRVEWGAPGKGAGTRSRTSRGNWHQPVRWNAEAERNGSRPFVFCASLADVFDNQVPTEWRADLFDLIRKTPRLVWPLLTKRPQNIVEMVDDLRAGLPCNAALGATCEDQKRADANRKHLAFSKSALRPAFTFLSCEPLLSGIELHLSPGGALQEDWIITGGETDQGAHRARPSNPQWFRNIRDQCAAAGVPFHHKQNGEWASVSEVEGSGEHFTFPDGRTVRRVGKKASGRTLDGVTHDAFPSIRKVQPEFVA